MVRLYTHVLVKASTMAILNSILFFWSRVSFVYLHSMKNILYSLSIVLVTLATASCNKGVDACASFNNTAYLVGDTILIDASCSENVTTYLWEPQAGLQMLGTGKSVTERFVVLPLGGTLSRTINLTVSNSKSTRQITKSAVVL
jgi:hypothetical protein